MFTWMTYQEWPLLFPLISSLLGLFFHFHLVMRAAKFFLRKEPSEYIPEDDAQQSFNQIIAVICLSIGYVSFLAGWTKIAYVFTIYAPSGSGSLCGHSWFLHWLLYRKKDPSKARLSK
ncbi:MULTISPECIES: DUF4395 family protein [Anoxybacillaceae]|uniref:DUF4395 family protein n=1 Tax=Anoxybacillaceae TaxID=3120669 RepID=UPI0028A19229|nr:DUF4395 family protein [Anoxybacillus rupiensis]